MLLELASDVSVGTKNGIVQLCIITTQETDNHYIKVTENVRDSVYHVLENMIHVIFSLTDVQLVYWMQIFFTRDFQIFYVFKSLLDISIEVSLN